MTQQGCGFLGSESSGFLVYFPTFVLSIDTLVDCHLSYETVDSYAPLHTLYYAQPRCPPKYYPSEVMPLSLIASPSPSTPAVVKDNKLAGPLVIPLEPVTLPTPPAPVDLTSLSHINSVL